MPGPHFMDLVIFGAGLLGVIALAIHLSHSLPKYTRYIQESNEHYAAGGQGIDLGIDPTLSALLVLCAGNSPVTGEFPAQRPVARSFDVFFDMHLE